MIRSAVAALLLLVTAVHAGGPPQGWKTYRSEELGWELSYPPDIELHVWFGGRSGELRDAATGDAVAELELWPPDLCPRQKPGATAKAIGLARLAAVTQADGADGSSSCGAPMAVKAFASDRGVPLYELTLACVSERTVRRRTVRTREGIKAPTFFADVSQPWRQRILTIDPVGVDPRMAPPKHPADLGSVRRILATLTIFPVPDPRVVCIEDLRPGDLGGTIAVPGSRR